MKLRFGPFVLDGEARQLLRSGEPRKLTPKALTLLELLLEQRPRAVSKQEILERLWPGTFVAESNVPALVNEVRAALEDDGRAPRYVRTVHRFGYAFCAPAAAVGHDEGGIVYCIVRGRHQYELQPGENVLGRTQDAAVAIDHGSVSRRHAVVRIQDGEAVLEDCDSKNGTFVGGQRLEGPVTLADCDEILLGAVRLVFRALHADATTTAWPSER
jgi:DNA-binding winged helix-turn-helix (wHTH) protein